MGRSTRSRRRSRPGQLLTIGVISAAAATLMSAPVASAATSQPRPPVPPRVSTGTRTVYRSVPLQTLDSASPLSIPYAAGGGLIVGQSYLAGAGDRAVVWGPDGSVRDLGTLGGRSSSASAVRPDGGVVVGDAAVTDNVRHAFRWTPSGGMQALPRPVGLLASTARAINRGDVVVGDGLEEASGTWRGLLWRPGTPVQLVGRPDQETQGVGVDAAGDALFTTRPVYSEEPPTQDPAPTQLLLLRPDGVTLDLLADVPNPVGRQSLSAVTIDAAGRVAAVVVDENAVWAFSVYEWVPQDGWRPRRVADDVDARSPVVLGDDGKLAWSAPRPGLPGEEFAGRAMVRGPSGGVTPVPGLDTGLSQVRALGADGTAVGRATSMAGLGGPHAVVWPPGADPIDLSVNPASPTGEVSTATALLADGRVLGTRGRDGYLGTLWVSEPRDGVSVRLRPVADTYVDEGSPTRVFGWTSSLAAGSPPSGLRRRALLRFEVPPAPPGTRLVSATLRLRTSALPFAGSTGLTPVGVPRGAWTEAGTTWTRRPTDPAALVGALTPADPNEQTTARLTVAAVRPGSVLDLELIGTGDTIWTWSRDYDRDSYRPGLDLWYEAVPLG